MSTSALPRPMGLSHRRIRRQSGSVATLGALWLMIAVICLATVDIGNVFWQKRELQKIADLAALAGAQGTPDANACRNGAGESLRVNGVPSSELSEAVNGFWRADPAPLFDPATTPANACKVLLTRQVPYLFFFQAGEGRELKATATAFRSPRVARLTVRSTLLALDTEKSALLNAVVGQMLGGSIKLDVVGWKGIADADISLLKFLDALKLRAKLNVGSYDEVAKAQVSLSDFMLAMADVLPVQGNAAALTALQSLAASVGKINVALTDILKLGTGLGTEALRTEVNVLDMVSLLAQLANKKNAVNVKAGVDLGLVRALVGLKVIEPPQSAMGDPDRDVIEAKTSQIDLVTELGLNLLLVADVSLALEVKVAEGRARVSGYQCLPAGKSLSIQATTGVASVKLKGNVQLLLSLVKIPIEINLPLNSGPQSLVVAQPPPPRLDQPPHWLSIRQSNLVQSLYAALSEQLGIVGALLATILSPLVAALDAVLNVLLNLLGISLANTEIGVQLNCGTNVELVY